MMRKGLTKGSGKKGYYNIIGKDPMVHRQSAMGIKQPQRMPQLHGGKSIAQIGDGKFPNKYWVSWTNDFIIAQKGQGNWASETLKFKVKGETIKKPFDTFQEALEYIDKNLYVSDEPQEDSVNTITIEDRLSGQVWEQGVTAFKKKPKGLVKNTGFAFHVETDEDTGFTKEKMAERGEKFK